MDEKRNSYIRKRASAISPFFSGGGSKVSSSTYKTPPAFIENTIVKPDDDVVEGKGKMLPGDAHMAKHTVSPIPETSPKEFPGSLRQNRAPRPHTSAGQHRNRVEKSYVRPGTVITSNSSVVGRRASTRDSLRSYELKSRLNDLTGSEIFKDAELSDSVYTDEEDEIAEAEKRRTVKPSQYTLPPLNIDTRRKGKRNSAEKKKKKTGKHENQRELKRTSERKLSPLRPMEVSLTIIIRRSYTILLRLPRRARGQRKHVLDLQSYTRPCRDTKTHDKSLTFPRTTQTQTRSQTLSDHQRSPQSDKPHQQPPSLQSPLPALSS